MKTLKKAGIYMDHANAAIIEFSDEVRTVRTIASDFSREDKEHTLRRSESEMHHKEQHKMAVYYKSLASAIREYDDVVLFGPTDAKSELFNFTQTLRIFDNIIIEVVDTDKISNTKQHDFIRKYFKEADQKTLAP